jgi:hypothetical protein
MVEAQSVLKVYQTGSLKAEVLRESSEGFLLLRLSDTRSSFGSIFL